MTTANWTDIAEKAEHYLALGQTDNYLHGDGPFPWDYVFDARFPDGQTWSNQDAYFKARHGTGITFRWSVDFKTFQGKLKLETIANLRLTLSDHPKMVAGLDEWISKYSHNTELEAEKHEADARNYRNNAASLRGLAGLTPQAD